MGSGKDLQWHAILEPLYGGRGRSLGFAVQRGRFVSRHNCIGGMFSDAWVLVILITCEYTQQGEGERGMSFNFIRDLVHWLENHDDDDGTISDPSVTRLPIPFPSSAGSY